MPEPTLGRSRRNGVMRAFRRDRTGIALIEFAFSFPLLLIAILGLLELANYAVVRLRLSQAALQIADNAGRIGERGLTGPQKISERMINDVLLGGALQGNKIDIANNGRIILSSLELNADGGQWVHWQRCSGGLTTSTSSYGRENDGTTGTSVAGMGPATTRIVAEANRPVMFVEIAYLHQPIGIPAITGLLIPSTPITEIASMPVRLDRDTTALTNGEGDPVSTC